MFVAKLKASLDYSTYLDKFTKLTSASVAYACGWSFLTNSQATQFWISASVGERLLRCLNHANSLTTIYFLLTVSYFALS